MEAEQQALVSRQAATQGFDDVRAVLRWLAAEAPDAAGFWPAQGVANHALCGEGVIDTTFLISHRLPLESAPDGYKMFKENQNEWTKVVLKPH